MPIHKLLAAFLLVLSVSGAFSAPEAPDALSNLKHFMFVSWLGRSHMIPYLEILQPLAARGHRVSVATDSHAAHTWLQAAYPGFSVQLLPDELMAYLARVMPALMPLMMTPEYSTRAFAMLTETLTTPTYEIITPPLRQMLEADRPDLLLCDWMVEACSDLAHTLGIPYAVTLSGIPPGVSTAPYTLDFINPHFHATTSEHLTFWQRFHMHFIAPRQQFRVMQGPLAELAALRTRLGIQVPPGPPHVVHARALKIINSFIGFETPRPIDPLVQLIGPIRSATNTSMPADLSTWIDRLPSNTATGSKGIIYVAFGTHVDAPDRVVQAIYAALVQILDSDASEVQGVIWAVSNIKRDRFPAEVDSRVLLVPFAPQKALLDHPAVRLFISHGGAESSHESMFAGKPMLVVPFFGDQPNNAAKLTQAGMAEFLHQSEVSTAAMAALLHRMLHPEAAGAYQAAASRLQALVRTLDRRNTAAAADMLEFFVQYGWEHLLPASLRMHHFKATNADLYAALALLVLLAAGLAAALLAAAAAAVRRQLLAAAAGTARSGSAGDAAGTCAAAASARPKGGAAAAYDVKAKAC